DRVTDDKHSILGGHVYGTYGTARFSSDDHSQAQVGLNESSCRDAAVKGAGHLMPPARQINRNVVTHHAAVVPATECRKLNAISDRPMGYDLAAAEAPVDPTVITPVCAVPSFDGEHDAALPQRPVCRHDRFARFQPEDSG